MTEIDKNSQTAFLSAFFAEMRDVGLNYAVLHAWQALPYEASSDVDMVIDDSGLGKLTEVLRKVENKTQWRMVQRLWYDVPNCHYYVAVSPDTKASVALDFLSDEHGIGEYRIRASLLLDDCIETRGIRHMSPESEVAYKLAKRRIKGIFRNSDFGFLEEYLPKCNKVKLSDRLRTYMPRSFVDKVMPLIESMPQVGEWADVMRKGRPALRLPGMNWTLHGDLRWWFFMICRTISRFVRQSGCIVYFVGDVAEAEKRQWDFGFTFRNVKIVRRCELTVLDRYKAFLSAWLIVAADSDLPAVECEAGNMIVVERNDDLRQVIVSELHKRYERNFA